MANPTIGNGVAQTMTNRNFIGANTLYTAFIKEQKDPKEFNPWGYEYVNSFFRENAMEENVEDIEYTHYEKTRANQRIICSCSQGAVSDESTSGATTITIASGSQFTFGSVRPYTASNDVKTQVPRLQEKLRFPNGVMGIVMSRDVANNTVSVQPMQIGDRIPATTTSQVVTSMGIAAQEGSGTPDPVSFRTSEFINSLWIAKDKVEFTDIAASITTWIDDKWTFTMKQWNEMLIKFNNELDYTLLFGEKITNPSVLAAFKQMPSGDGYVPYIENFGYNVNFSNGTGITLPDIDKIITKKEQIGGSAESALIGGTAPRLKFHDLLRDTSGNASFVSFSKGKEQAINLNFSSLHRLNYTFHIKSAPIMNHPELAGAEGHDTSNMLIVMPMGSTAETGTGRRSSLKVRCLNKANGYQGGYHERFRSGLTDTDMDEHMSAYDVSARKGIEAYGQEQHMILKGS